MHTLPLHTPTHAQPPFGFYSVGVEGVSLGNQSVLPVGNTRGTWFFIRCSKSFCCSAVRGVVVVVDTRDYVMDRFMSCTHTYL